VRVSRPGHAGSLSLLSLELSFPCDAVACSFCRIAAGLFTMPTRWRLSWETSSTGAPQRSYFYQPIAVSKPWSRINAVRRAHVWWAFDAGEWIERCRPSDSRVPLRAGMRWWRDVGPMCPRLRRYEVCVEATAEAAAASPAQDRLALNLKVWQSAWLVGFGCRCGTCDIGYYSLWGQCHECGSQALVIFLSQAVPALGTVAGTAFFFWGGVLALPRRQRFA
jgi:hypothetical protein